MEDKCRYNQNHMPGALCQNMHVQYGSSAYAHHLDLEHNQACREINACFKACTVEYLYVLAGIIPPEI